MGYLHLALITGYAGRHDNQKGYTNQSDDSKKNIIIQVGFGSSVYTFRLTGVTSCELKNIPTIVPYLEEALRDSFRKEEEQRIQLKYPKDELTKHFPTIFAEIKAKLKYSHHRQITYGRKNSSDTTVSARTASSSTIVRAGTASALSKALQAVKDNSDITTLMTYSKDQGYFLEKEYKTVKKVEGLFSKIEPIDFKNLSRLQIEVVDHASPIINGVRGLLARRCLVNLQSLELQLARLQVSTYKPEDGAPCRRFVHQYYELKALIALFQEMTPLSLPHLENLQLPCITADGTTAAIALLDRFIAQLKNLTIDLALPEAQKANEDNWPVKEPYYTGTDKIFIPINRLEILFTTEGFSSKVPALRTFFAEKRGENQLECLKIFNLPVNEKAYRAIFEHQMLSDIVADGALPKLNKLHIASTIVLAGAIRNESDQTPAIDTAESKLLSAANTPSLRELVLTAPEAKNFEEWLQYLKVTKHPFLERLHYRVPSPYSGESAENHKARVKQTLQYIDDAITADMLPNLSTLILEGEISEDLQVLIAKMEEKLTHPQNSSASLTTSSSSSSIISFATAQSS